MSSEIKQGLQRFIHQEEQLLHQLNELQNKQSKPVSEIEKIIGSELGGAITEELLGSGRRHGKRIGKAIVTEAQQQKMRSEEDSVASQHQYIVSLILNFLSNISVRKRGLKEPNSHILIDKINRAQNIVKFETRIRRTMISLQSILNMDLILNTDIPKMLKETTRPSTIIEPYAILKTLETMLRKCIQTRLQSITPDWWKIRIPEDVRQNAEDRKSRNEKPWPWIDQKDFHLINYVDFTDYAKIIRRKDNWNEAFKHVFGDPEIISAKLKELEPIRNVIAHNRELTNRDMKRLEYLASDITWCLNTVINNQ